ncbi:MAG: hypothetical protein GY816_15810 [Cytophagales bacterium]|nr:hypothetical protein [Cytophagales bacterium]
MNVELLYINDTDVPITITNGSSCGFDEGNKITDEYLIPPQGTLILHITNSTYQGAGPSINEIDIYASDCYAIYGDLEMCDYGYISGLGNTGLADISNYDNRTKISKNSFEFTYRFTEETKAAAVPCE